MIIACKYFVRLQQTNLAHAIFSACIDDTGTLTPGKIYKRYFAAALNADELASHCLDLVLADGNLTYGVRPTAGTVHSGCFDGAQLANR